MKRRVLVMLAALGGFVLGAVLGTVLGHAVPSALHTSALDAEAIEPYARQAGATIGAIWLGRRALRRTGS